MGDITMIGQPVVASWVRLSETASAGPSMVRVKDVNFTVADNESWRRDCCCPYRLFREARKIMKR